MGTNLALLMFPPSNPTQTSRVRIQILCNFCPPHTLTSQVTLSTVFSDTFSLLQLFALQSNTPTQLVPVSKQGSFHSPWYAFGHRTLDPRDRDRSRIILAIQIERLNLDLVQFTSVVDHQLVEEFG